MEEIDIHCVSKYDTGDLTQEIIDCISDKFKLNHKTYVKDKITKHMWTIELESIQDLFDLREELFDDIIITSTNTFLICDKDVIYSSKDFRENLENDDEDEDEE